MFHNNALIIFLSYELKICKLIRAAANNDVATVRALCESKVDLEHEDKVTSDCLHR